MAEKEDYDPYEHREVAHPISNFGAFLNVIKAIIGTGILAAPMAFRNAGYLPAIISSILIGLIVIYSKLILLSGMYELARRKRVPLLPYGEAMMIGVTEGPPFFRWLRFFLNDLVKTMLFVNHFGACAVYVIFIANCMKDFGDYYWEEHDNRIYMAMEIVPLCLIFCIPSLKALVPFVLVANIALIFGFAIIFYYIFSDMTAFSEMTSFQDIHLYPLFFGATMFGFDAPGLIVSIEANAKNPADFRSICGVFMQAMLIIITMQTAFAFFGYWRYGEQIASTILHNLPFNAALAAMARIIFAFSIFVSIPLQGYVPIDIVWNNWLKAKVAEKRSFALEMVFRIAIAVSTVLIGIACPKLTLVLSLMGALCMSCLGLILPAILDICVKYETGYGPLKLYLLLSTLSVFIGIVGAVAGTYVAIHEWILMYTDRKHMYTDIK
ncbi:proton-coupled amino acid transporter-like protein CG1139 isoform X1 [Anastrepha obliqua]|uniref:proton-coupled amino acid transporter-like protein CG1139 isoform X1 n=2 Tax=Anastrepha obliqua TaxID=95512 RepID=UPI002409D56E|nr:proton-coupled amino acid transporter-like protein CG1139 isoform X1 [Anastrepha obliqua]